MMNKASPSLHFCALITIQTAILSGSIVVTKPSKNFSFSESANQEMVMRNTVQPTVFFINNSVNLTLVGLRGC